MFWRQSRTNKFLSCLGLLCLVLVAFDLQTKQNESGIVTGKPLSNGKGRLTREVDDSAIAAQDEIATMPTLKKIVSKNVKPKPVSGPSRKQRAKVRRNSNAKDESLKETRSVAAISSIDQTTGRSLWKNEYNLVHIMWTRFMQLQPNLMHLGKARIKLFKTFTLPCMLAQSTQEYLWLILTDPELDQELLKEMVELIKSYPNVILLGTDQTMGDFRDPKWLKGAKAVFSGDTQLLNDYQKASQNHVLVETRIDADDSMYREFMRSLQIQTAKTLGVSARKNNNDVKILSQQKEFRILCPLHHMEWGYFNPWQRNSTKGHLFGIESPEFCITAGLTFAFQIGTKSKEVKKGHHRLAATYSQCSSTHNNSNCIDRIDDNGFKYTILRSRTPTSAGMAGVIPTPAVKNSRVWASMQEKVWDRYIFHNFAMTPESIWELREYLTENMEKILLDALEGQCTRKEFTCKQSSRESLTNLLLEVRMQSGEAQ